MKKVKVTFDQFFEEYYGTRWTSLRKAILEKNFRVLRSVLEDIETEVPWLKNARAYTDDTSHMKDEVNESHCSSYYVMDPASILVANTLEVKPGERVLDMCSAPGGKGLILFENLRGEGEIVLNEFSKARREKLKNVIRQYIPDEQRKIIKISGKDGIRFGIVEPESYDGILVDAPCSGEKHLLLDSKELKTWSPKRTKRLASIQYGLLCSALLALKEGGQMVYSTCTISPVENDSVVEKLLEKKGDILQLDLPVFPTELPESYVEKTKYGFIFLPDRCGFGPLYVTRFKKVRINE